MTFEFLNPTGCRTSRPPLRGRPGPMWPSSPRHLGRLGRSPLERRAAGTGFWLRTPVVTANSNSPRTAAMRRFSVAGAGPRRSASRMTFAPALGLGWACQAR
jgi:hypothetical protein